MKCTLFFVICFTCSNHYLLALNQQVFSEIRLHRSFVQVTWHPRKFGGMLQKARDVALNHLLFSNVKIVIQGGETGSGSIIDAPGKNVWCRVIGNTKFPVSFSKGSYPHKTEFQIVNTQHAYIIKT